MPIRTETSSGYYSQFAEVGGVTIKANDQVDPATLQEVAKIIPLMLDGRPSIAECIRRARSSFAVIPKGAPVTDLPEFAFLKGQKDHWGTPLDEPLEIYGLGAIPDNPVTAVTEQSLLRDPDFPGEFSWVAVHEFGHHLMNLCFSRSERRAWERLHKETLDTALEWERRLLINADEFFAVLTEIYFGVSPSVPKARLTEFPSGVVQRLEEIYGILTPVETQNPRLVRFVSSSGYPTPWVIAIGGSYEHGTFDYTIELLPGWKIERDDYFELLVSAGGWAYVRVLYIEIPFVLDPDAELTKLAEDSRDAWLNWSENWDRAEVKSFKRISHNGHDAYRIHFNGHQSPRNCVHDETQLVLITSHNMRSYGIFVNGWGCETRLNAEQIDATLRSFTP